MKYWYSPKNNEFYTVQETTENPDGNVHPDSAEGCIEVIQATLITYSNPPSGQMMVYSDGIFSFKDIYSKSQLAAIAANQLKASAQTELIKTDYWDNVSYRCKHETDISPSLSDKDNYRNLLRDVASGKSTTMPVSPVVQSN